MRRKLDLIESSPSASAESWREESQADEREDLAAVKETLALRERVSSGTETDMKDQPLQARLPENDDSI